MFAPPDLLRIATRLCARRRRRRCRSVSFVCARSRICVREECEVRHFRWDATHTAQSVYGTASNTNKNNIYKCKFTTPDAPHSPQGTLACIRHTFIPDGTHTGVGVLIVRTETPTSHARPSPKSPARICQHTHRHTHCARCRRIRASHGHEW